MDFRKLTQAVQYYEITWFTNKQTLSECLRSVNTKTGDTVLHLACRFGRCDMHQFLCKQADIDTELLEVSNYEGKRPLHEAAQFGQFQCVQFLLNKGVKVDCLKRADWTPLMLACTKCDQEVISVLMTHGADPSLVNKDGWNCFHIAAREGCTEILNKLLEANPDLWKTASHNGRTPLHTAGYVSANVTWVAQKLARASKADVTKEDNLNLQPVHHAAQSGQREAVEFLLSQCHIAVNTATTDTRITVLHIAAKEGQTAVLKLLIEHGADVNLRDHKGRTALHIASGSQHADSICLLLNSGALSLPDSQGHLPQHYAVKDSVKEQFIRHLNGAR